MAKHHPVVGGCGEKRFREATGKASCLSFLKYKLRIVVHISLRRYDDTMNMGSIWHRRHLINVNFPLTITQRIVVSSTTMLLLLLASSQKVRWVAIESWILGPYFYIYPSIFHSLKPCNFQFLQQKAECALLPNRLNAVTSNPKVSVS